ncbi:MAG: carboxypeptidase-like regulatory domain-containing protein [Pseudomonadota bacterium]
MKKLTVLIVFALIFAGCGGGVLGTTFTDTPSEPVSDNTLAISGKAMISDDQPIANGSVSAYNFDTGDLLWGATSDDEGNFSLNMDVANLSQNAAKAVELSSILRIFIIVQDPDSDAIVIVYYEIDLLSSDPVIIDVNPSTYSAMDSFFSCAGEDYNPANGIPACFLSKVADEGVDPMCAYSLSKKLGNAASLDGAGASQSLACLKKFQDVGISMGINPLAIANGTVEHTVLYQIAMRLSEINGKTTQAWLNCYQKSLEFRNSFNNLVNDGFGADPNCRETIGDEENLDELSLFVLGTNNRFELALIAGSDISDMDVELYNVGDNASQFKELIDQHGGNQVIISDFDKKIAYIRECAQRFERTQCYASVYVVIRGEDMDDYKKEGGKDWASIFAGPCTWDLSSNKDPEPGDTISYKSLVDVALEFGWPEGAVDCLCDKAYNKFNATVCLPIDKLKMVIEECGIDDDEEDYGGPLANVRLYFDNWPEVQDSVDPNAQVGINCSPGAEFYGDNALFMKDFSPINNDGNIWVQIPQEAEGKGWTCVIFLWVGDEGNTHNAIFEGKNQITFNYNSEGPYDMHVYLKENKGPGEMLCKENCMAVVVNVLNSAEFESGPAWAVCSPPDMNNSFNGENIIYAQKSEYYQEYGVMKFLLPRADVRCIFLYGGDLGKPAAQLSSSDGFVFVFTGEEEEPVNISGKFVVKVPLIFNAMFEDGLDNNGVANRMLIARCFSSDNPSFPPKFKFVKEMPEIIEAGGNVVMQTKITEKGTYYCTLTGDRNGDGIWDLFGVIDNKIIAGKNNPGDITEEGFIEFIFNMKEMYPIPVELSAAPELAALVDGPGMASVHLVCEDDLGQMILDPGITEEQGLDVTQQMTIYPDVDAGAVGNCYGQFRIDDVPTGHGWLKPDGTKLRFNYLDLSDNDCQYNDMIGLYIGCKDVLTSFVSPPQ